MFQVSSFQKSVAPISVTNSSQVLHHGRYCPWVRHDLGRSAGPRADNARTPPPGSLSAYTLGVRYDARHHTHTHTSFPGGASLAAIAHAMAAATHPTLCGGGCGLRSALQPPDRPPITDAPRALAVAAGPRLRAATARLLNLRLILNLNLN